MTVSRAIAAVALFTIAIALVAFLASNAEPRVDISLFWFRTYYDVRLILALFFAFVIGSVLTLLYCLYYFVDLGLTVRRLKKRNRALEAELVAIRSLPIEEALGEIGPAREEQEKDVVP